MADEPSIFTKIINREVPGEIVWENDQIIILKDIQPHAPIHLLGISKYPFRSLHELLADPHNKDLLWDLLSALREQAIKAGIAERGYRIVTNIGEEGGQKVPHLHIHLLGGKKLSE